MVAQVWQAAGSFGLQLLAAWLLGASGLGLLSLCLSIIILATAVTSGMVGDSLVILDRRNRAIRAGLQFWALVLAGRLLRSDGRRAAGQWLAHPDRSRC